MRITGIDSLTRKLKELERAVSSLDGDVAHLTFDPLDPQSIEIAIQELYSIIDRRTAGYTQNDFVSQIVDDLKERGRKDILDRAASARQETESNDDI